METNIGHIYTVKSMSKAYHLLLYFYIPTGVEREIQDGYYSLAFNDFLLPGVYGGFLEHVLCMISLF